MDTKQPDPADSVAVARTLAAALDAMPQPLLAVMDGALFDDLPSNLQRADISNRSLFLDHADADVERAGPWLVALDNAEARAHVGALALVQPCAVFWSCPEGEMALWRHLRTINQILIPLEGEATDQESKEPSLLPGYERVMFRHWDPNVLAALMPQLDSAQFARVFGPATYIAINATDFGGLKRIPIPDNLPPAPHGPLRLQPEQMNGLRETMMNASRGRIEDYLLEVAPFETSALGEARIKELVMFSEKTGTHLGLKSEQAHGRWAYVMVRTNGQALEQPGLREWITDGKGHPDEKMRALLNSMGDAERAM